MQSILNQSLQEFELIIVFNGLDCKKLKYSNFLKSDPRIRTFWMLDPCLPRALNYGISKSKTPIICRMDSDDIAAPNRLEKQFNFLKLHQDIFLVGSNIKYFGTKTHTKRYPEKHINILIEAIFCNPFAHPTIMFRKKEFTKLGGYSNRYPYNQDYDLYCRALLKNKKMENIQENLLYYRIHKNSMTNLINKYNKEKSELKIKKTFLRKLIGSNNIKNIQTAINIGNSCFGTAKKTQILHSDILQLFFKLRSIMLKKTKRIENVSIELSKYFSFLLFACDNIKNKEKLLSDFYYKLNLRKNKIYFQKLLVLFLFKMLKIQKKDLLKIKNFINAFTNI